jgi:hypothetical protein
LFGQNLIQILKKKYLLSIFFEDDLKIFFNSLQKFKTRQALGFVSTIKASGTIFNEKINKISK